MSATTAASSSSNRASASASPSDHQLRFGWWMLLFSLSLGIVLEALHGLKIGWYLDAGNDMRRVMFTLAHAHGALLALVNIAAGICSRLVPGFDLTRATSSLLIASTVLLPLGFFSGGLVVYQGDPGLGIILVPIGAILLLIAVAAIARGISRAIRTNST